MRRNGCYLILFTAVFAVIFYACNQPGNDKPEPDNGDAFKRAMLVNYADQIIVPGYKDLADNLTALETAVNAFLAAPGSTTLEATKQPFKSTYLSFQSVSVAYFGPASALLLNNYINTFPAVPLKIEQAIQSGSYNFTLPVVNDSIQGLPTLDYLLYGPESLGKYSGANSAARIKYTKEVLSRIKLLVNNTLSDWNGAYRETFINSLKTNVGSSIGFLVNQFAYEMDALKGPRIGWPFGKLSNGKVFADKCEGYYLGISRDLSVANLTSLKKYFVGGNGDGISDYLVLLKKEELNTQVLSQFDVAINALKAIPQPMSESFSKNPALVEEAYRQVQKLLTLIKTDVASATAVQITYMDNDGD